MLKTFFLETMIMARPNTRWERRDKKRDNRRKMGVDGKSIFTIVEEQVKRKEKSKKEK